MSNEMISINETIVLNFKNDILKNDKIIIKA